MIDSCSGDLGECYFIKKLKISGVLFEGRATQAQKTYQIGQNGLCVIGQVLSSKGLQKFLVFFMK